MGIDAAVLVVDAFFDLPRILSGVLVLVALVLPNVVGDAHMVS